MNYAVLVFAALLFGSGVGAGIAGFITIPDAEEIDPDTTPSVLINYDAEFAIYPPQDVQFFSIVEGGNGELTYIWTFDEQIISMGQNPIITFEHPGTYMIELTVTDEDNDYGTAEIEVETGPYWADHVHIEVDQGNEFFDDDATHTYGPTFDLDNEFVGSGSDVILMAYPPTGSAPLEVFFNPMILGVFNWFGWDYGDGTDHSGGTSTYHTFTEPGNYSVTFTAGSTFEGDSASDTKIIQVTDGSGSSGSSDDYSFEGWTFGAEIDDHIMTGVAPFLVNLNGSSYGYPDQDLKYSWILDENIVVGWTKDLTWIFTEPGIHRLTFVVRNYLGWTAWDTTYMEILEPEHGGFDALIHIASWHEDNYIQMNGFSVNGVGNISYQWYVNGLQASSYRHYSVHFITPGEKEILLTIEDEAGNTAQDIEIITISIDTIPIPRIIVSYPMNDPGKYHFEVDVTGGNGNLTYLWDFGDGYVSEEVDPIHVYEWNDQFIISVIVTDEDGDSGEDVILYYVLSVEEEF